MPGAFQFAESLRFWPAIASDLLAAIPAAPGVFALRGERAVDEPYLTRTVDLRRRMTRLLAPPEPSAIGTAQSKRLNLRNRVHTIAYTVTGSEFESLLVLADAAATFFGPEEARRRLRLGTPFFLRLTSEHQHPRVYTTNRLARRALAQTYGPFPSRTAAERYCDAVLDLFKLRRCYEDLHVSPDHPGCAYGEMKRCMAPCNQTCTAEEYAAEARAVAGFLATHGESLLGAISVEREQASAEMEFERAAELHERYVRVKTATGLADELVRAVPLLRAVIVQPAARRDDTQEATVFLLEGGCLYGPERLSTLGVRAVKEQTSVGSSLFAQPLMLQAVPLTGEPATAAESPETRTELVLAALAAKVSVSAPETLAALTSLSDHLSLLRRWYYRPEKSRTGEIFFANPDGTWPVRRILRGAARMALGEPKAMADTQRDQVQAARTRILHEGREGVERAVPSTGKRRKAGSRFSVLSSQEEPGQTGAAEQVDTVAGTKVTAS